MTCREARKGGGEEGRREVAGWGLGLVGLAHFRLAAGLTGDAGPAG